MMKIVCPSPGTAFASGPYGRTYLLNGRRLKPLDDDQVAAIGDCAAKWSQYGLSPGTKVFGPLRGLSVLASGTLRPVIGVAPLIVSLEGYLLGKKVTGGIAAALARRIRRVLGQSSPEGLEEMVRRLYAWRSDIIHGRTISVESLGELIDWLCWLTRIVVRCGVQRVLEQRSDGNDLLVVRGDGHNVGA